MRINKVKWKDHPILGNLELDFHNSSTGTQYETILFAGENGTGKTTILDTISTFLDGGTFEFFDFIDYTAGGKQLKAVETNHSTVKSFYAIIDGSETLPINSDKQRPSPEHDNNPLNIRFSGCVASKARADYKTTQIKSTTTKQLDIEKFDIDQDDDFTSLKQLIVDVESQDKSEYADLNESLGSSPKSWSDFYPSSKIYRFKNAFNQFFEKIKYVKVADIESEKTILFEKNSKTIHIDKLSTGEKQIVFRGIYLLKNSNKLDGAVIMIDEPELSMHPKWQKSILQYYKDLFSDSGIQKTQIFIATHSENVVTAALKDGSNLIIVLNESGGTIVPNKIDAPSVLPSITSAETNYLAFDVVSNDYHIELYGWLQDKEYKSSIKSCDDFIVNHTNYNASIHEKTSSFGTTNYKSLCTYIRNAIHHPDSGNTFTEDELRLSTELLIDLCR